MVRLTDHPRRQAARSRGAARRRALLTARRWQRGPGEPASLGQALLDELLALGIILELVALR